MGKTPKPLRIMVVGLEDQAEFQALRDKGHEVEVSLESPYDLILGPRCWRLDKPLLKFLDLALDAAKAMRYPKQREEE